MKLGDYYKPGLEDEAPVWTARRAFLAAVQRSAQHVLEALRDDALLLYQSAVSLSVRAKENPDVLVFDRRLEGRPASLLPKDLSRWSSIKAVDDTYHPLFSTLMDVLIGWAERFNIHTDWILDEAIGTLLAWTCDKERLTNLEWGPVDLLRGADLSEYGTPGWEERMRIAMIMPFLNASTDAHDFSLDIRPWNPLLKSWSEYSSEAKTEFNMALERYRLKMTTLAEAQGYKAVSQLRKEWHFEALVRHQILGESINDLTTVFSDQPGGLDNTTIGKAIRGKAELIGLAQRK